MRDDYSEDMRGESHQHGITLFGWRQTSWFVLDFGKSTVCAFIFRVTRAYVKIVSSNNPEERGQRKSQNRWMRVPFTPRVSSGGFREVGAVLGVSEMTFPEARALVRGTESGMIRGCTFLSP